MSTLSNKLKNLTDYRSTVGPDVKDKIIVEYAPLIKYIAQKIASRLPANIELDDLISCGVIGLMDAIEKFDPSRDNKFKTYAEFRIRGAILDELRAQDWVPRSIREKAKLVERTYSKLEASLGRPATDEEMCEELHISQEEFHDLLNKAKSISLLNIDDSATFNRGDKKLIAGVMESSKTSNPFVAVSHSDIREKIKEGIKALPEKQRLVLSLYYYEDLNLKEIGQVLDVTESRVSQLHTQAIIKLKSKLKGVFDSPEDLSM
ncbi:MAG: RNA polymerase subunit sigma [Bdellovibrionales bacterium RIFOXYD12_FULL_39_22]|nr:MAG: RNA polymerase subunit sigma [Bdellovibrionales bacterium RIFOXYB1_FULL_39_21]OFZ42831.1 MAG: RNA polymerase subunit sigma [Bdellovibrionales bacterium RIFOXYC12_FULL_39_17]OFZ47509.1 MAG: RNA polymerase subunit sigma [Bdellovibrionales bacterium RIFOXYC1_FULL_39_130]OFZ71697.1 MAG: RNA polymerase subunit sigma [Bdellovibrionales bacterium RIFOXYC2_FULL_39_8]OFZ75597.1 MAG: RNA polymerase subunit sigma [Bdellovibrionales bacterium RIFOXYD1_FULL_39_84]OFZ93920.1 MAG: RNA polymerase subu